MSYQFIYMLYIVYVCLSVYMFHVSWITYIHYSPCLYEMCAILNQQKKFTADQMVRKIT